MVVQKGAKGRIWKAFGEHMWKREKEQSIPEASRMKDHMSWPTIHLKASRE